MHLSKVVPILGLAATAAYAEPETACGSISTVYTTVPASPVTETFTITAAASSSIASSGSVSTNAAGVSVTSTDTMTATVHTTLTSVISVEEASSAPFVAGQGPYSFNVNNGVTSWFGGRVPPSTDNLVTSTSVVTLVPVPESSPVSGEVPEPTTGDTPTTSYTTTFLTTEVSLIRTETLTESMPSGVASAKIFSGLGSSGWNVTYTTFKTVKISQGGNRVAKSEFPKTGLDGETRLPLPGSTLTLPASSPSISVTKHKHARQLGAVIEATIDGVIVSWTNNYQGSSASTSGHSGPALPMTTPSIVSSVMSSSVVPVYPWQTSFSGPAASATVVSGTLLSVPTTTLPIYPWNLTPSPSSVFSASIPTIGPSLPATSQSISHTSYSNTTTATSIPATATNSCGTQAAGFTINFDDLPRFSTGPTDTDIPPIMNPYNKLFFEAGFGYVPPPSDPFKPISPPQLAVYRNYNRTAMTVSPDAGLQLPGEIGAGPRASESAYWIDVYSAYLGCDNVGHADCTITINGYIHTFPNPQVSQTVTQPACPGLVNCNLGFVEFPGDFRSLSGVQFLATVGGEPVNWYMDDLTLGWSNNTCAAQLERASAH